jgi:hypothetical protein
MRRGVPMEYKQFIVRDLDRAPALGRASLERANGKALLKAIARRRRALHTFVTAMDAATADAAMQMAIAAIDANAFSRISIGDERQARLRQTLLHRGNAHRNGSRRCRHSSRAPDDDATPIDRVSSWPVN